MLKFFAKCLLHNEVGSLEDNLIEFPSIKFRKETWHVVWSYFILFLAMDGWEYFQLV